MVTNKIKPDDFVRSLDFYEEEGILLTSWLKKDKFDKNCFSIDSCLDLCIHCWI